MSVILPPPLLQFNYMNRNDTAVREEMVHLANFIDSVSTYTNTHAILPDRLELTALCVTTTMCAQIYIQLNVRVVLVGLEIWTHQNLISTDGGAGEVLSRFTQWREKALVPRRRHDSAQLILSVLRHMARIPAQGMADVDEGSVVTGRRVLEEQLGWPSSPLSAPGVMGAALMRYAPSWFRSFCLA